MAHCTGFLAKPDFWQTEVDAPILKFNRNEWLQQHTPEAVGRAQRWLTYLGVTQSRVDCDLTPLNDEGARIFRADANRTYRSEPCRQVVVKLLKFAQTKFGDYQQSMGYVAGLMLLFFDAATTFKVLTVLNDHPRFLTGYWRGEATACAVDGYICMGLMKPTMRDHLLKLGLLPETFVQKWFAGVCIHHLPYSLLMDFLDKFFEHGNHYLFQFFLAFFDEFDEDLMRMTSNPDANALIRLESAPEARLERVIEAASGARYVDVLRSVDLHRLRAAAFDERLSQRLQSANEGMWQKRDDDITFSDEED
mmetsp:Transcript_109261/g.308231  ORF Transcript_109261/g.308231 Transcript_109261/m.308231 type:complete len:307 (-) Transcript_109261:165-1085(-)